MWRQLGWQSILASSPAYKLSLKGLLAKAPRSNTSWIQQLAFTSGATALTVKANGPGLVVALKGAAVGKGKTLAHGTMAATLDPTGQFLTTTIQVGGAGNRERITEE